MDVRETVLFLHSLVVSIILMLALSLHAIYKSKQRSPVCVNQKTIK